MTSDLVSIPSSFVPIFLAQLPSASSSGLGSWLVNAAAAAALLLLLTKLYKEFVPGKQTADPTPAQNATQILVSRDECHRAHDKLETFLTTNFNRISDEIEALNQSMGNSIRGVHARVDQVMSHTSHVEGQVEQLSQRVKKS
jgi:hypothetical protein